MGAPPPTRAKKESVKTLVASWRGRSTGVVSWGVHKKEREARRVVEPPLEVF